MRKICLLSGSVAALCALLAAAAAWQRVEFTDSGLEAAVREKLGNPQRPLSRTELLQLSRLDASGRKISRLDGIEYLRQLVALDLSNNRVEDLAPLQTLRKLREINLSKNSIRSLQDVHFDALADIPLRRLDLSHNRIAGPRSGAEDRTGISPLGRFASLEYLALRDNPIADITPLRPLAHLRSLDLRGNQVTDISPLIGLQALAELNLRENDVADLSPLSGLTGLTYLNIHSNPRLRSLRPLAGLTRLTTLIMRNVPAGDGLGALRRLTRLNRLNARNCGIADASVLGELMAKGALQDDPKTKARAAVNLLDNPLPGAGYDPYLPIRRYWKNIAGRSPIDLPYVPSRVPPPVFSRPGGFCAEPFELTLSSDDPASAIFYTLDGSTPTEESARYAGPLPIRNPAGDLPSGVVVRARAVAKSGGSSRVATRTYFFGSEEVRRHTLPVVSLATDSANFFDREIGIYNECNALKTGRAWERPVSIEFYEPDGRLGFALDGGVRIHGAWSRRLRHKSLRLYARPDYGPDSAFRYRLFPGLTETGSGETRDEFQVLVLHNSGNDYNRTIFRDALLQGLVEHGLSLETQASRFVAVYLNGVYWGLCNLRERYDEHFLAMNYDVPPDRVAILELDAQIKRGRPSDRAHYLALREYARTHDLSDPAHYDRLAGMMDPQSYIEYYAANIYFHNIDWAYNNIDYWRIRPAGDASDALPGRDGRWRWMLQDVDSGFTFTRPPFRTIGRFERKHGLSSGPSANTLKWALMVRDLRFQRRWPNLLFRKLLENEDFRVAFINHMADRLNSSFAPERVIRRIDEIEQTLAPEMEAHIRRWQNMENTENWRSNVEELRRFARERPENVRRHFVDHFGLSGTARVTLKAGSGKGRIRINGLEIAEGTPGVRDPGNWSGVYFRDVPITIAAEPAEGWRFTGWEGIEASGPEASITLTLEGDIALTARFERE